VTKIEHDINPIKYKAALKGRDRFIKYNIARHIDYILDTKNPKARRAVRLYQIQVAILLGVRLKPFQQKKREQFGSWLRVPRSILLASKCVSTMRLLEYYAKKKFPNHDIYYPLRKMRSYSNSRDILKIFSSYAMWKNIGYSLSWHDLDRELIRRRRNQKTFAALYDISVRYNDDMKIGPKCNVTTAATILSYTAKEREYAVIRSHYPYLQSRDTAFTYKDKKDYLSCFIWLDHYYGRYMRPLRPFDQRFAEKLLRKVDDVEGLERFLGQYEAVRGRLLSNGYKPLKMRLQRPIEPIELSIAPVPEQVLQCIFK